ncbi:MAG: hypothetical protein II653_00695 [Lachnospiraceae bacterium]|jgi:hypothetical protein|nr:hypothetical protein [Lachnospiraceae bacterium]
MDLQINQIITELAKIDSATNSIIASVDDEKKSYSDRKAKELAEYDKSLDIRMENELKDFKNAFSKESTERLEHMRMTTESEINSLSQAFEKNHTKLAQDIFKQLIVNEESR